MNSQNAQELPMRQQPFEERCEEYFMSEYRRRLDGYLREISLIDCSSPRVAANLAQVTTLSPIICPTASKMTFCRTC